MHHVRQELSLADLSRAVKLFSRNVHDESLPTSIQTMSCKLLLNLVECIKSRSEQENANGRNLLMQMMEVFVLKFKTVAKLQLPVLMARHRQVPHPSSGGQAAGGGDECRDPGDGQGHQGRGHLHSGEYGIFLFSYSSVVLFYLKHHHEMCIIFQLILFAKIFSKSHFSPQVLAHSAE